MTSWYPGYRPDPGAGFLPNGRGGEPLRAPGVSGTVSALHARRAPPRSAPSLEACIGGAAASMAYGLFVLAALPDVYAIRMSPHSARVPTTIAATYVRPPPGDNDLYGYDKDTDLGNGSPGKRHVGAEGRMGSHAAKRDHGLYGLKGRRDEPDPHLARRRAMEEGRSAGMLAVMRGSRIASIFGRDTAVGRDADDALGGLVGTQVQEARGAGGLALVGTGPGGRGAGEGTVGLTSCGGIGKGGG